MVINEEKIRKLLIDAKVIQDGHFKLNSGVHSDTYLEKFNLLQWPDTMCHFFVRMGRFHGGKDVG